ncbi:MAG: response regulator [Candidatus Rokubacteria bacterium]|nr:response regulator [Candidatus Rokubacteria bacterium]
MAAAPRVPPGVKVDVDPEEVPPVAGDPNGLREALAHVIVNAAEATPVGGKVTVAVRAENGDATVVITDHGEGMSPDIQARAFEPFFTTRPQATGLGLCLTHAVVARHGGNIEIESEGGKGTTVTLRLPAQTAHRTRGAAAPAPTGPTGPARCLVVDDDPQVREMLRDVLRNGGHTVVTAVDGADGVERFKAGSFDIVITDLAMPKLNGLQLTRVCKTLRPQIPVLMLTGWGVMLTEAELAEHGVDEVLSKPVRMEAVLTTVAALRARPVEGAEVTAS